MTQIKRASRAERRVTGVQAASRENHWPTLHGLHGLDYHCNLC